MSEPEEHSGAPLIPFGLPEGYREAAEGFWADRELGPGYIRRILGLPEDEAPEP